jgi:hypothetical protein
MYIPAVAIYVFVCAATGAVVRTVAIQYISICINMYIYIYIYS